VKDGFDIQFLSAATLMGALIGLGQLLNSQEKLTWRVIVGRAMVSAGLAACAPVLLLFFPAMPPMAEFAIAAVFASLGTSGLQLIVMRVLGGSR
jgi:hypothetical protein